jgi:hypothetical protein
VVRITRSFRRICTTHADTPRFGSSAKTAPRLSSTVAEQTPTESTTTTPQPRINGLTGTDGLGFIGYPAARCTLGSEPASEVRTTQLIVVCQTGPGSFYYRGLRLSDGAGIELANGRAGG